MTNNKEPIIYKNKALRDLKGLKDVLMGAGDIFLGSILNRAIECIENQKEIPYEEIANALNNN